MKTNLKQSSPVAEYLNPYFISGFAPPPPFTGGHGPKIPPGRGKGGGLVRGGARC